MAESALQNLFASSSAKRILDTLPNVLNIVLVSVLGYWASVLIWMVVPVPESRPAPVNNAQGSAQQTRQAVLHGAQIANKSIFGRADQPKPEVKDKNIRKSTLNLKLIGVLSRNPAEQALAIVSTGRGQENVYGIGDVLPGNAELVEVHPDHIIIEHQGRYEKLELPKDAGVSLATNTPVRSAPRSTASRNQPVSPQRATQLRSEFLANPGKVLNLVNLRQERRDGKLLGYKLTPKGDPALFYELGLQDGDVITAVNGVPVSNQRGLGSLRNADRYDVTVMRGGVETALSLSFK